jgi:hypothetical protein
MQPNSQAQRKRGGLPLSFVDCASCCLASNGKYRIGKLAGGTATAVIDLPALATLSFRNGFGSACT